MNKSYRDMTVRELLRALPREPGLPSKTILAARARMRINEALAMLRTHADEITDEDVFELEEIFYSKKEEKHGVLPTASL